MSDLVIKGLPNVTFDYITGEYNEYKGANGIALMIVTTLWIISVTLIVSGITGVFVVYLAEYSRPHSIVELIRFALKAWPVYRQLFMGFWLYFFKNILKLFFILSHH